MLLKLPRDCWLEIVSYLNTCDKLVLNLTASACVIPKSKLNLKDIPASLTLYQWLLANNLIVKSSTLFAVAARGGHLEVLKWLRKKGYPWNQWTCTYTARSGHLEVLKWLRKEGCPLSEDIYISAAREGQLEVLKWLRQEIKLWHPAVFTAAAQNKHSKVLEWLKREGCPYNLTQHYY